MVIALSKQLILDILGHIHSFSIYLIAYGVFRFLIEFLRDDPRGKLFGLVSPSQFWSILMIGLGIALIFLLPKLYKKDNIDNAIKKHS